MSRASRQVSRSAESEIRIVVEVDGKPVGFMNVDLNRLWPLINHRKRDVAPPAEWIDRQPFRTALRASVAKNLTNHLQSQLYKTLGKEIVRAELSLETLVMKAEAAAQIFGNTKEEAAAYAAKSGRTFDELETFFWESLLNDSDPSDLKKNWKAAGKSKKRRDKGTDT